MDVFAGKPIWHGLGGPAAVLVAIAAIIVGLRKGYVSFRKGAGMSEAQYSSSHNYITLYRATG